MDSDIFKGAPVHIFFLTINPVHSSSDPWIITDIDIASVSPHEVGQVLLVGIRQSVGQRVCGKTHKITGANLKGFIAYFRITSAGEYVKELLVNVMAVKLGGFSARFYSYQVHAKCLKS